MLAEDLLKSGDVSGALKELAKAVRAKPSEARLRIFLFQLLCVTGDWDRAIRQLKLSAELDPAAVPMAQAYREAIICELYREKVFAGEKAPLVFGQPHRWIALMIEALRPLAAGEVSRAADLRAEAFELAPAVPGQADEKPFAWIADADSRLGPVLEVIVDGKYYWAPFGAIASLSFDEPSDLRDRVWTPVEIRWANGGEVIGFIPTRYPFTARDGDDAQRLARATAWRDLGAETYAGLGQRVLATDADDLALMDLRRVSFDTGAAAEDADG
ncbi:MAG: virulence protein SciE type [Alphaproteobacteria bacterium]|nr:MAG: virulence protein SciE type [Alphaproteobacteria bacterium]